jgi:biofilm PGA synthesis N-glycosyltransferase PgaC
MIADAILGGSLALAAVPFAVYPPLAGALARWRRKPHLVDETYLPAVTVVVAAWNEEVVIGAKVENILALDYPADRLDAIVISDESTDRTDEIVREKGGPRVKLVRQPRAGKAEALRRAMDMATAEVLVFTDANVIFEKDAIRKLVRHLADPEVGGVTGTVHLVDGKVGYAQSEGLYYKLERFIQRAESDFESIVGVDGALYAMKRAVVRHPPRGVVIDDFVISMDVAVRGHRVLYEPDAVAWEDAAPTVEQEFRRKTRVAMGAFQALRNLWGVPTLRTPRLVFSYAGHKLFRWIAPWALVAVLLSSAALAPRGGFYAALFAAQAVAYALAAVGLLVPAARARRAVAVPFYFVLMNAAFAWGFVKAVRGTGRGTWTKVDRTLVAQPVTAGAAPKSPFAEAA